MRGCEGEIADLYRQRELSWLPAKPGGTSLHHLHTLGALGPRTLLVHGVQLSVADRNLTRATETAWVHCPKSNAKLGNGVAPLALLRECFTDRAERLGLGTDSVASNNGMDLLEEARFAVLMHRAANRTFRALTAKHALEMATMGGARALGLDREVGSLEPGKRADIAVVDLGGHCTLPVHDPVSALIYSASGRDVVFTMCNGQVIYQQGDWPLLDWRNVQKQAAAAAQAVHNWEAA